MPGRYRGVGAVPACGGATERRLIGDESRIRSGAVVSEKSLSGRLARWRSEATEDVLDNAPREGGSARSSCIFRRRFPPFPERRRLGVERVLLAGDVERMRGNSALASGRRIADCPVIGALRDAFSESFGFFMIVSSCEKGGARAIRDAWEFSTERGRIESAGSIAELRRVSCGLPRPCSPSRRWSGIRSSSPGAVNDDRGERTLRWHIPWHVGRLPG